MSTIPEAVVVDARAKIIWGEDSAKVMAFLQTKGVVDNEALALIAGFVNERSELIRADGIKKTSLGILFVAAPVAYYFLGQLVGYWSLKFFAATLVLGVVGLVKLSGGLTMVLRPRSVTGDLADAGG